MSLAEETRAAARRRPFLVDALRAGVVNYTAAARALVEEIDGDADRDSVATALRRFAESLPDHDADSRTVRVSMRSGLGEVEASASGANSGATDESHDGTADEATDATAEGSSSSADAADALVAVGGTRLAPGEGSLTGVLAAGEVDASALGHVLGRLAAESVAVRAAGFAGESLLVAVERRDGPDALRVVEDALEAVPRSASGSVGE